MYIVTSWFNMFDRKKKSKYLKEQYITISSMFYKQTEFVSYSNIMSYPNTSNLNSSVKNIEETLLIIKNEVLSMRGDITKLKTQFDHQFGPHISENDMSWIEEDSHQTGNYNIILILCFNCIKIFTVSN